MVRKAVKVIRLGTPMVLTLAAAGTAAIWVLSCTTVGKSLFADGAPKRSYDFRLTCPRGGSIAVVSCRFVTAEELSRIPIPRFRYGSVPYWHERLGFKVVTRVSSGRKAPEVIYSEGFMFPAWLPFIAFGTYPTTAFIRGPLRRHRRRKRGLCINCGYNLTGNESGVCPECGEAACSTRA